MTEVVEQVVVKCPSCQTEISTKVTKMDLVMEGKNINCPICTAVLWIALNQESEQIIPKAQFPFAVLV